MPLAQTDGGWRSEDEGARPEVVLELHVALHQGQGDPLLAARAFRVQQQAFPSDKSPYTVPILSCSEGLFAKYSLSEKTLDESGICLHREW
jgi:hypothetical protein